MASLKTIGPISLAFVLAFSAWAQSDTDQNSTTESKQEHKRDPGAAREIGAGAGAAGTGAAKGAGDAAKGAGKAAGDLITLHPVNAGVAAGKGAAGAGKDVTVGAAKGTGKVTKGIGRVFRKLF